ncbi:MAG: hypothetical protein ACKOGA_08425, partial [Planctomycetaceae bacterium]
MLCPAWRRLDRFPKGGLTSRAGDLGWSGAGLGARPGGSTGIGGIRAGVCREIVRGHLVSPGGGQSESAAP